MSTENECESCEGTGKDFHSCCGVDMRGNDYDICPDCKEHTGWSGLKDAEFCTECHGTGRNREELYITFTPDTLKEFKKKRTIAVKKEKTEFEFEGSTFLTSYAKYVIEYLDMRMKEDNFPRLGRP